MTEPMTNPPIPPAVVEELKEPLRRVLALRNELASIRSPTLVHRDEAIKDAWALDAIIQYLARLEPKLFPDGPGYLGPPGPPKPPGPESDRMNRMG